MKSSILALACAPLALFSSSHAYAAKITSLKLDNGSIALFVIGSIEHGDGAKFRSEASKYEQADVLLESDGGALADALEIGEAIRLKGYGTAVLNGSDCNSSCALIWLAGAPRALSKSGRVGFHAAYTDNSGTAQESGVANAMVGRYLTLLNLPEKAVIFATSAPPSKLTWLTTENFLESGIDVKVIGDIDWGHSAVASSAPKPPPPIVVVESPIIPPVAPPPNSKLDVDLWKNVGSWEVDMDHTIANGCFMLTKFDTRTVLRVGVDRTRKDSYYILFGNTNWTSLEPGERFDLTFQFDNNSPWNGPALTMQMGNEKYLRANFTGPQFWTEFASSTVLNITRNGAPVAKLNIAGSKPAFDQLVACQRAGDAQTRAQDPFAQ